MEQMQTLGGRAIFRYEFIDDQVWIEYGPQRRRSLVTQAIINQTRNRINELDVQFRTQTSQYTDTKWHDCPNRILCPYVAKLIQQGIL